MIRTATKKDIDGLLYVSSAAFNQDLKKGSKKWSEKKADISHELKQWRIMLENGRIIGAVHIKKDWLRIGKAKILKGDVGGVCIHPEMQGKGLGTLILEDTIKWMNKCDYDLSRLGGLCKYYSRFGYKRFSRRYFEFNVGTVARAGASRIIEGAVPIAKECLAKIRPFHSAKDHASALVLSENFNSLYNGSRVLSAEEKKQPAQCKKRDPLNLVYEENGKIIGHIQTTESEDEISDFEARIRIHLHGYDPQKPYVIQALLAHINNYAFKKGIKRMTARMPFDSSIIQALTELPLRFKTIETYGGISSNMLQIVNLHSIFSRMKPELEQRLQKSMASNWEGSLSLGIGKESVFLIIDKGNISISKNENSDANIKLHETDMLRLVLGLSSFSELNVQKDKKAPEANTLLSILFPRKAASSVNWC